MASSYTTNLAIEKPSAGDKTGTWGTTVNINSDIIDQAINGVASLILTATGSTSTPNDIDITEGSVSDGRNQFIELTDTADLGGTVYLRLTPSNAEKICYMRNSLSASRDIVVFQGTYNASNAFTLTNGKDAVLKFSGGGASATVEAVFQDLIVQGISTTTFSLGGTAVTATGAELNILDGVTSTAAELNILDGVTATATELNYVDGVTSNVQTQLNAKADAADPTFTGTAEFNAISIGGTVITSTAAELNILDGVTATATELNYVDGVTSNVQTQLDTKAPAADPVFTGAIGEEVYALAGTDIDPANGTIQYKELTAATTFTESLTSGEYVTLMIDDGTGDYGITWPAITWLTSDGSAPALQNTGYTVIELFKVTDGVTTTLFGAVVNAA